MVRIIACVCLGICLISSGLARSSEGRPNLTGKWVLNMKLSNLDWPPKNRTKFDCCETKSAFEIIEDKEPHLTITRSVVELDEKGKERTRQYVIKMTTDDQETTNPGDDAAIITAHWNSDRLIINMVYENKRFPRNIEFRSVSKDGKTMTVELYVGRVEGQPAVTEVFERSDH